MSTGQTLQISSTSSEETEKIGQQLGARLKGGEVIELVSDLGGGKTTFVRGLVKGAGSNDHVSSPTFTISNIYKTNDFDIHHFDFYRLHEAGLIEHEIKEKLEDPKDVVIVEWSDVVAHVLPKQKMTIRIKTTSDDKRVITFSCSESLNYISKGLSN